MKKPISFTYIYKHLSGEMIIVYNKTAEGSKWTIHAMYAFSLCLMIAACQPQRATKDTGEAEKATLIIHNAKILTLNEQNTIAQAVAIKNGKILAAGTNAEIEKIASSSTQVIDAEGKTLIPGLNDSHSHVIRGGRFYNTELRWDGVKSLKQGLQMIREQADRTPEGQWVKVVGGWSQMQFEEKRMPTIKEIREVAPHWSVFVLYLYGEGFMNEAAMKAAGIDKNTPDPPGGIIERDESGAPTGRLIALPNAFILYSTIAKAPVLSFEEQLNSTKQYVRELNRFGITSVVDPGGGFQNFPKDYATTDTLTKRGELNLRIPFYLFAQKAGSEYEDYLQWVNLAKEKHSMEEEAYHHYFLEGGGENLVMAAADFENFRQERPQLDTAMEAKLKKVVSLLVENRWPFRLHATYDESISRFLNVFEEINKEKPFNGLSWYFDHAETISENNLQRVKALGGGIAIQNRMSYQGENFVDRYGRGAAASSPPVKKMLQMGIPVALGTDATRVSSYHPWQALYWLVSGRTAGGLEIYPKENRLDRLTALRLMTVGSARLTGEEEVKGQIEPGYYADMALLSDDYLTVEEAKIPAIESLLTLIDGKIVYGQGKFESLSPVALPVMPAWSPAAYYNGYGGKNKHSHKIIFFPCSIYALKFFLSVFPYILEDISKPNTYSLKTFLLMNYSWLFIGIALLAGAGLPLQACLNTQIGNSRTSHVSSVCFLYSRRFKFAAHPHIDESSPARCFQWIQVCGIWHWMSGTLCAFLLPPP